MGCAFSLVVLIGVVASPASAAFPGRNGLLAVQPLTGPGLVLVNSRGGHERRICTNRSRCRSPRIPRWSPDGRALTFNASSVHLIYSDGSCLNCHLGGAGTPAFTANPTLVTFVSSGRLVEDGIDGLRKGTLLNRSFSDAVWSAPGALAGVHAGRLWIGSPHRMRPFGAGRSPSWSPSGAHIAIARKGWVVVLGVRDGSVRRLVRGGTPAWSPDGRSIAFIGSDHALRIMAASGGRARRVGRVRGFAVDWQPVPRAPLARCVAPPGSTLIASSPSAVVTGDANAASSAYMGCLRADGRERFLERLGGVTDFSTAGVLRAAVGDGYAALVNTSQDRYNGPRDVVAVFDLRTGAAPTALGRESAGCSELVSGGCQASIDRIVVGGNGVSAAHVTTSLAPGSLSSPFLSVSCPSPSLCVVVDGFRRVLVSADPTGGARGWAVAVTGVDAVSCPSTSLCVGVGGPNVSTSTNPTGGPGAWAPVVVDAGNGYALSAISCPSISLCVAVDRAGNIFTSNNPTGGAAAWTAANVDGTQPLYAISCPSTSLCVATDYTGHAITSTNPTGGAGAWRVHAVFGRSSYVSVSCPSAMLCVGLDDVGDALTSTDPTSSTPWTSVHPPGNPRAVDCPSTSLCLAVGENGTVDVSRNPSAGAWTSSIIDNRQLLRSISCPSSSFCVIGDAVGNVVASSNPTAGSAAWTATLVDGDPCTNGTWCTTEQIVASDGTGVHTLDTLTAPGRGPLLSGLNLSGYVLAWDHAGTARGIELQP